ncbi:MAG: glycosyltransferase family 2 protein [Bacteroidales bacterium]|nr:glycosyltransferase family 2 protein [Bacteroidales bacterium]
MDSKSNISDCKLSASIITFNEEKNIERCLISLQGIVDEVVVVDSYSTDKTEQICSKYGVRFIKNEFKGHVEQKNFAVSQCTHNYILALDADEALSETLRNSILKVKANWSADVYIFNRLTYFCGKPIRHGAWFPDPSLRLWDRRCGAWGGDNPHDKFIPVKSASKKFLDGLLDHYSYHTIEEYVVQINKFSTISAHSKFKKGKKSSLFKVLVYPRWRFFRDYFIKLGILDGWYGYVVCKSCAYEVFLKYQKLMMLQNKQ